MSGQNNIHYFMDPVCKINVPKSNKIHSFNYHSEIYYFCSETCRNVFISDPDKYQIAKPIKRKGLWARYLGRLNKATGGRPPCCH